MTAEIPICFVARARYAITRNPDSRRKETRVRLEWRHAGRAPARCRCVRLHEASATHSPSTQGVVKQNRPKRKFPLPLHRTQKEDDVADGRRREASTIIPSFGDTAISRVMGTNSREACTRRGHYQEQKGRCPSFDRKRSPD